MLRLSPEIVISKKDGKSYLLDVSSADDSFYEVGGVLQELLHLIQDGQLTDSWIAQYSPEDQKEIAEFLKDLRELGIIRDE